MLCCRVAMKGLFLSIDPIADHRQHEDEEARPADQAPAPLAPSGFTKQELLTTAIVHCHIMTAWC